MRETIDRWSCPLNAVEIAEFGYDLAGRIYDHDLDGLISRQPDVNGELDEQLAQARKQARPPNPKSKQAA